MSNQSEMGAGIQCLFCRSLNITNSTFRNMTSQVGGAIYLTDQPENKRDVEPDISKKYIISKSLFENIDAYMGGALFLDHPQSMIIEDSTFRNLRALNRSSEEQTDKPSGKGGAMIYSCSRDDPDCSLAISGNTVFQNNFAQIMGGAIHWDYVEPQFSNSITFAGNLAGWYGDSISCYSQQLKTISKEEFKS